MNEYKISRFKHIEVCTTLREAVNQEAKARIPRYSSYEDIPKFPFGYREPDDVSEEGKKLAERPPWLHKHSFAGDRLSSNWLSSTPTRFQYMNLLYQLEQHALSTGGTYLDWKTSSATDVETFVANYGDEDVDQPHDVLTLPSRRVENGKTPCTTYRGAAFKQIENPQKDKDHQDLPQVQQPEQNRNQDKDQVDQDQDKHNDKGKTRFVSSDKKDQNRHDRNNRPLIIGDGEQVSMHKLKHEQGQEKNETHKGQQGKEKDKGKDKNKDPEDHVPNSYHILRFMDRRRNKARRYVEFLRDDSKGYVYAFRFLAEIGQAAGACFVCCSDVFGQLTRDLPFFKFKKMHFGSGYDQVDKVKFAKDTIGIIFDILFECYENPEFYFHVNLSYLLQVFFVLFGEGPRFEEVRRLFCLRLEEDVTHSDSPTLGVVMDNLIHNWSNLSQTAFLLKLVLLEEEVAVRLIQQRPNLKDPQRPHETLLDVFDQFDAHAFLAHKRCSNIVDNIKGFNSILNLEMDEDAVGNLRYGLTAFKQIVRDQVPFLLYIPDIAPAIMMRRDKMYDGMLYPAIKLLEDNAAVAAKAVDSGKKEAEAMLRKRLASFQEKTGTTDLLSMLSSYLPCLEEFSFSRHDPDLHGLLVDVCQLFNLELKRNLTVKDAGSSARREHPSFFTKENLSVICDFLESSLQKGRSHEAARQNEKSLLERVTRLKSKGRKIRHRCK